MSTVRPFVVSLIAGASVGVTVISMIEILSANKITIDTIGDKEPFLVCEKKEDGGLLIMGLDKYLKIGWQCSSEKGSVVENDEKRKRGE